MISEEFFLLQNGPMKSQKRQSKEKFYVAYFAIYFLDIFTL